MRSLAQHQPQVEPTFNPVRVGASLSVTNQAHTVPHLQAKLTATTPGDIYEQEADRVSEQVTSMTAPRLQRACACGGECPKCQTGQPAQEGEHLQTKRVGSDDLGHSTVSPIIDEVLRSPGQHLDPATRALMEPRFGHSFANVRVHTDSRAAQSAEAVNALAYTVGDHIVFGAGQHAPASSRGQRLLAHELTHVVQQNGGQTLRGEFGGRHDIARAPISLMPRKGPLSDEEERKQEEARQQHDSKSQAVKRHIEQQRNVADLLDKARKTPPDPKKGLRDPDNLFRNTVGLLDAGKFSLTILTPTHYSPSNRPVYFDSRVRYPNIGGDYPADPKVSGAGLVVASPSVAGQTSTPPAIPQIQTMSGKPLGQPSATPLWTALDVTLFLPEKKISEGDLRNVFVHEGQHVADMSAPKTQSVSDWQGVLEIYKAEFRAYWIQPPKPLLCASQICLAPPPIDNLPEPTSGKASNSRKVTIAQSQSCTICPATDASVKERKTGLKNQRQEDIFWHLISHSTSAHINASQTDSQFACCYVNNKDFRREVDNYAYPAGVNLINSNRLMDLNLELRNLKSSMTLAEVSGTSFVAVLKQLEPLDWAFLKDMQLSKPFWDAFNAAAPGFLRKGVNALVKKGAKKPVAASDVDDALAGKLKP